MDDLATQADVSRATLYRLFPGKAALFRAIVVAYSPIEPVLAVYAGYSLRQERVAPGPELEPYVKDALDEIEYVAGGPGTTWGARRGMFDTIGTRRAAV